MSNNLCLIQQTISEAKMLMFPMQGWWVCISEPSQMDMLSLLVLFALTSSLAGILLILSFVVDLVSLQLRLTPKYFKHRKCFLWVCKIAAAKMLTWQSYLFISLLRTPCSCVLTGQAFLPVPSHFRVTSDFSVFVETATKNKRFWTIEIPSESQTGTFLAFFSVLASQMVFKVNFV